MNYQQPVSFTLLLFTCVLLIAADLPAQTVHRLPVLVNQSDSRSSALANATVADIYGRASSGINPAHTALYRHKRVIQLDQSYNWRTNLVQFAVSLPVLNVANHHLALRSGYFMRAGGSLMLSESPRYPVPDIHGYHAEITYAYAFSEVFSLGTSVLLTHLDRQDEPEPAAALQIGLLYVPADNVSYAAVIRGIGNQRYYEVASADVDETGTPATLDATTLTGTESLQQSFEIGTTFRFPVEQRTWMSLSLANEKRLDEKGIWYKAGLEIVPYHWLALRGGVHFHIGQDRYIPRAGVALQFRFLDITHALAPQQANGEHFHQIGITIRF